MEMGLGWDLEKNLCLVKQKSFCLKMMKCFYSQNQILQGSLIIRLMIVLMVKGTQMLLEKAKAIEILFLEMHFQIQKIHLLRLGFLELKDKSFLMMELLIFLLAC